MDGNPGPAPGAGWRRARSLLLFLTPFLVALGLFFLRRQLIMVTLENELACRGCMVDRQLLADGPMLAAVALFTALSLVAERWWWRLPLRLLLLAVAVIYLGDVYVYRNFFVRLQLRDAVIYGAQVHLAWHQFLDSLSAFEAFVLAAAVLPVLTLVFWPGPRPGRVSPNPMLAGCLAVLVLAGLANGLWRPKFSNTWIVRNVFAHNFQQGVVTPYSAADSTRLKARMEGTTPACLTGAPGRPSMVLLITESWSPYHSQLWSGINDWTPRLDAIARNSRYFTRFYAGGENTNAGLISILLGLDFYSPVKDSLNLAPYEGLWGRKSSLPLQLGALGYDTAFMTTGDLSFSNKGEWMRNIGFGEVDGDASPEYDGAPRESFNAAPDEYLYRKALAYIQGHKDRPFLLVLENVSTHHPYRHPFLGIPSERAVFHYFDQAASRFYRELKGQGFLADNLLMVVSDHRAMTRIRPGETERFGDSAPARIPAFIASDRIPPGPVDAPLHQSDILPSLVNRVAGSACSSQDVADLFNPKVEPDRCLCHAPNSDWNVVRAYCGARTYTVHLDGSRSFVEAEDGGVVPDAGALLDTVATTRLFPKISRVTLAPTHPAHAAVGASTP